MTDNTSTIDARLAKTTKNFAVFESPDTLQGQMLTGTYVSLEQFDEVPDFAHVNLSPIADPDDAPDSGINVRLSRETKNYAVYEAPDELTGQAISGMYVSHEHFDADAPEFLNVSLDGFEPDSDEQ